MLLLFFNSKSTIKYLREILAHYVSAKSSHESTSVRDYSSVPGRGIKKDVAIAKTTSTKPVTNAA